MDSSKGIPANLCQPFILLSHGVVFGEPLEGLYVYVTPPVALGPGPLLPWGPAPCCPGARPPLQSCPASHLFLHVSLLFSISS